MISEPNGESEWYRNRLVLIGSTWQKPHMEQIRARFVGRGITVCSLLDPQDLFPSDLKAADEVRARIDLRDPKFAPRGDYQEQEEYYQLLTAIRTARVALLVNTRPEPQVVAVPGSSPEPQAPRRRSLFRRQRGAPSDVPPEKLDTPDGTILTYTEPGEIGKAEVYALEEAGRFGLTVFTMIVPRHKVDTEITPSDYTVLDAPTPDHENVNRVFRAL